MLARYDRKVVLRNSAQQTATVPSWNLSAEDVIVMMIQATSRYVAPVWASAHGKVFACNRCPNKQCIWNFAGGDNYNGRSFNPCELTAPGHACHPKITELCYSHLQDTHGSSTIARCERGLWGTCYSDTALFETWHPALKDPGEKRLGHKNPIYWLHCMKDRRPSKMLSIPWSNAAGLVASNTQEWVKRPLGDEPLRLWECSSSARRLRSGDIRLWMNLTSRSKTLCHGL